MKKHQNGPTVCKDQKLIEKTSYLKKRIKNSTVFLQICFQMETSCNWKFAVEKTIDDTHQSLSNQLGSKVCWPSADLHFNSQRTKRSFSVTHPFRLFCCDANDVFVLTRKCVNDKMLILISKDAQHGVMSDINSVINLQCGTLRPYCQI